MNKEIQVTSESESLRLSYQKVCQGQNRHEASVNAYGHEF